MCSALPNCPKLLCCRSSAAEAPHYEPRKFTSLDLAASYLVFALQSTITSFSLTRPTQSDTDTHRQTQTRTPRTHNHTLHRKRSARAYSPAREQPLLSRSALGSAAADQTVYEGPTDCTCTVHSCRYLRDKVDSDVRYWLPRVVDPCRSEALQPCPSEREQDMAWGE